MRGNWNRALIALLVAPGICLCQDSRDLFYHEQQDNDKLPPPIRIKKVTTSTGTTTNTKKTQAAAAGPVAAVPHFGVRYNILKVDPSSGDTTHVDPDATFHSGDCLQIDFFPNRSGYLYVIAQGSSKTWKPLLPSPDAPEESNIARSRTTMRVPQDSCFKIKDPPGDERLFIVLSRNVEDISELHDAIKKGAGGKSPAATPPADSGGALLTADNRLDAEMRRISDLKSRDIEIEKIARPQKSDEPAQSVYVTNVSDTPSDRLILEIKIKHR
jgi:hypothetical protein